jgi:hypothetical protein
VISEGTIQFFGAIGEKKDFRFLDLSEAFQDREKVTGVFLVKSAGKEVNLLKGFFNRLDEMLFFNPRDLRFFAAKKGPDDLLNTGGGGF